MVYLNFSHVISIVVDGIETKSKGRPSRNSNDPVDFGVLRPLKFLQIVLVAQHAAGLRETHLTSESPPADGSALSSNMLQNVKGCTTMMTTSGSVLPV